jgi:hypothetical protein
MLKTISTNGNSTLVDVSQTWGYYTSFDAAIDKRGPYHGLLPMKSNRTLQVRTFQSSSCLQQALSDVFPLFQPNIAWTYFLELFFEPK